MIGWPRFSSDICLISWRMIDMTSLSVECLLPAFWSRLFAWKHDDRTRCLASADELVRGGSLPKRKGFDNVARYHPLCDGIEQGFCCGVVFVSVRQVMRKHWTGDHERPADAQIFDEVDRIRNARRLAVSCAHTDQPQAVE